MRQINTEELCEREVINLCGGERLGYPTGFEIDLEDGRIIAIIVSENCFSLFGKKEEYLIPWCKIECIGEDAILVKIPQTELCCRNPNEKNNKKRFLK